MSTKINSIRSFIGAKDYNESLSFYKHWGYSELTFGPKMSYIKVTENIGFYLQDYYVKDWVDNTMLFLEVDDLITYAKQLSNMKLTELFPSVKMSEIKKEEWGMELFLHDPSGILWHVGQFYESPT